MPTVSFFCGIVIMVNFEDHPPPHFHARYGSCNAVYDIRTQELIEGKMLTRENRMIQKWAQEHQDELIENWERGVKAEKMQEIEPWE